MQTLRETLQLFWPVATSFAKRRLRLALRLVTSRAVLAPERPRRRGELTFERVTFSYREARAVLQGVSFTVPSGKTIALVGLSGSGKSSLIRLLFRLYEPDAGRILLDGTPLRDLSLSALRRAVAVVPQDTVLFNDTIAANIGFGRVGASLLDIQAAARIANLHDYISKLPYGYDTVIGGRGQALSSGERQRVAIARAALKQPRIFVFDAAISALDPNTELEIRRNLLGVSGHSTMLVIAHRLSMVRHADQILLLDRGEIVERGTHEQLCALNGAYMALWLAQQSAVPQREELPASAAQGQRPFLPRAQTGLGGAFRGVAEHSNAPHLSPPPA
jgi:ATP-binding cassette, subfamily B, heavy metal transporter